MAKFVYDAQMNENIGDAAWEAVSLARKEKQEIEFKFNGISMNVGPERDWMQVEELYKSIYHTKMLENDAREQEICDGIVAGLAKPLQQGLTRTIEWVKTYTGHLNYRYCDPHAEQVVAALSGAGYKAGEFDGDSRIGSDRDVTGRFIVGQLMQKLEAQKLLAREPITPAFISDSKTVTCDTFLRLPSRQEVQQRAVRLQMERGL